jgi:hypothetical protein
MNIGPFGSRLHFLRIGDDLALLAQFELNVRWLGRATRATVFIHPRVFAAAVGAGPLHLHIADSFLCQCHTPIF